MPRYFFHIRSPDMFMPDEVGIELRDLDAARAAAIQGARDIMAENLRAGRGVDHQRFEICDEAGNLDLVLTFRDVLPASE
ncbi:DUF6894 family protein [Enterovirga rhinocerotis]|uniref:DUF6894 domain-containing protein n=1 Tax=Enterovirga rhinocerotis TaxID=1339210 RepID=A0A4R7BN20_9HYPH|nr:hypothetical protein [Enterovirga rhinocerotis]TDR85306.1 hypothetical protein EV668_4861 [Enterovirga rhinocerotis]